MYYLVDIKLSRPNWVDDEFQRLVKAKDKNEAYDKTKQYLQNVYISWDHASNKNLTYHINVLDTIL